MVKNQHPGSLLSLSLSLSSISFPMPGMGQATSLLPSLADAEEHHSETGGGQ